MENLKINRNNFSELFWNIICQNSENFLQNDWNQLKNDLERLEVNRLSADYNTGSINLSASFFLYALCKYFQPTLVAEVGTFIGKSTLAMAKSLEKNKISEIYTCDYSNAIKLDLLTSTRVSQFMNKSSVQMFDSIKTESKYIDMFFFDGRIGKQDIMIIPEISHKSSIFAFDDFEGIEKGVSNAMALSSKGILTNYMLIYPPSNYILSKYGFATQCSIACFVPLDSLRFVSQ